MKRSRRKKPLPGKQAPKGNPIPFHRELAAMQIHCDQMNAALDWKDPGRVRSTACHVALAWLEMEAAFIRFIERTPAGLGLGSKAWRERLTLTRSNHLVRALFQRALDETPRWTVSRGELHALRVVLRWLHERLQLWSVVELPVLHRSAKREST
jgi:hypothetical protein